MAESSKNRPLTRASVEEAHKLIEPYIHKTPVVQCTTISDLASTPQSASALPSSDERPAHPKLNIFFKCENFQKVGAFKARGAFHALSRLTEEELARGVITHSSGNHAQALALAARTKGIKAHVVMPSISTPSKIAATKGYGANVVFSGSTAAEREAVVAEIQKETGAVLVPPYDHPDIMLGQGTLALEFEAQVAEMCREDETGPHGLDAVIAPAGGAGMLSGVAIALADNGVMVFGAEPEFEGADDLRRGLAADPPARIESVKTLTIADGLRTPVGLIPWTIVSDKKKIRGVFSVTEEQIKKAVRLLLERAKLFVEPSGAVALAVALYNEEFRKIAEREGGEKGWNLGIVISGGNTTVEAIAKLFAVDEKTAERSAGTVGKDGEHVAENVAG